MSLCCFNGQNTDTEKWLYESVSEEEELSENTRWMTNLPKALTTIPTTQLAIPGSHDSGAYYLDLDTPVSPDESNFIKFVGRTKCGKEVIRRWSLTQKSTITDQLNKGIRYFDMRIGYLKDKNDFFFVHGIYGYPISKLLAEMATFLKMNPKEILIIDFNHFYSFDEGLHSVFINNVVFKYLKDFLFPGQGKVVDFTLSEIWKSGKQVVARYCDGSVCTKYTEFWCEASIYSPWFNTDSITTLISNLNDRFNTLKSDTFNIFQAILTPQTKTIIKNVASSLEKCLADPGDQHIKGWLENINTERKKGVNIVICDFISSQTVIPCVLALNDLLLGDHVVKEKINIQE